MQLLTSIADLKALQQILQQKLLEFSNDIASQKQIIGDKTIERKDWVNICDYEDTTFRKLTDDR